MEILDLKKVTVSTITSKDSTDAAKKKTLPQDLIIDILSRLPTKNLCSFRCVSKPWLNLLTNDSHFAHFHFNRLRQSNPNPAILFLRKKQRLRRSNLTLATDFESADKPINLDVPFHVGKLGTYTLHGIQNGLICLSCKGGDNIYIWNPFTRDYITIPKYKRTATYAFCYHQETKEYKVITVWESDLDFHSYAAVYTLGIDSWRRVDKDIPYIVLLSTGSSLVNGVLHWLTFKREGLNRLIIVAFDMKEESIQTILPPNEATILDKIAELGGLLCIFCAHSKDVVEIWVMQEYGVVDSWAKLYKIENPEVCRSFFDRKPVGIVVHSGEVLAKKSRTKLIFHDPKSKSLSKTRDLGFEFSEFYTYIGTIISPRFICNQAYHDIEETRKRKR